MTKFVLKTPVQLIEYCSQDIHINLLHYAYNITYEKNRFLKSPGVRHQTFALSQSLQNVSFQNPRNF